MNPRQSELRLHEEILLLALRDERGTIDHRAAYYRYAMAGGLLAELLLADRIKLTSDRRPFVELADDRPLGDPTLDDVLLRIRDARRKARLSAWVERLAGIRDLRQRVARGLCERGILREREESVLLFFTRVVYPTIDPRQEEALLKRLRAAVCESEPKLELRTSILAALASGADLLAVSFSRQELRAHKARIKALRAGNLLGLATYEAVQQAVAAACAAASAAAIAAACG